MHIFQPNTFFRQHQQKPALPFTQSPPRPFGDFEIRRRLRCRHLRDGRRGGVGRGVLRRSREEVGDGDEFAAAEGVDEPNVAEDQPGDGNGDIHEDDML